MSGPTDFCLQPPIAEDNSVFVGGGGWLGLLLSLRHGAPVKTGEVYSGHRIFEI